MIHRIFLAFESKQNSTFFYFSLPSQSIVCTSLSFDGRTFSSNRSFSLSFSPQNGNLIFTRHKRILCAKLTSLYQSSTFRMNVVRDDIRSTGAFDKEEARIAVCDRGASRGTQVSIILNVTAHKAAADIAYTHQESHCVGDDVAKLATSHRRSYSLPIARCKSLGRLWNQSSTTTKRKDRGRWERGTDERERDALHPRR